MASASCTLFCFASHFILFLLVSIFVNYSESCPGNAFNFSCPDNINNGEFPISYFTNISLRSIGCGGPCELQCEDSYTTIKCTYLDEEPTHPVLKINPTKPHLDVTIAVDDPDMWLHDPCKDYFVLHYSFPYFQSVSLWMNNSGETSSQKKNSGETETFLGCPFDEGDQFWDNRYSSCSYLGKWKDSVVYGPFYDHLPLQKLPPPQCLKFAMHFSLPGPEESTPAPVSSPNDTRKPWKIILSVLSVIAISVAALIVVIFYRRQRNGKPSLRPLPSSIMSLVHTRSDLEEGSTNNGITVFPYAELQEVTNNFDPARELGEGGFGVVYHGKLKDGREVAVKRMFEKNYRQIEQFKNEIQLLTNVRHPNLVTLYGSTSRHSRELLLVYEYIPNGTLSDHLHGCQSKSVLLLWPARLNIAIQTASALCYLHFKDIIHRDVKSNNILLDKTFVAKVADFGLSRLFPSDVSHVSTAPQGTPGYLDPEYHQCYHLTDRSDVYSFGVVLVELISSREAVDFEREGHEVNLANYAMNRIQGCEFGELVDVNLGYDKSFKVRRMTNLVAELAFRCLQHEREIRPSMEEVLEELKRIESVDYEDLEAEEIGNLMILQRS